jgi:hypothetical protein
MKYKDYLILPVLIMYLIYASCAYIAKVDGTAEKHASIPSVTVDPSLIVWSDSDSNEGEFWYADGIRGTAYFSVNSSASGETTIRFYGGTNSGKSQTVTESVCTIRNKHLQCTNDGLKYDFVFPDQMTAYETVSGIRYQRADSSQMKTQLTSGRFVNESNPGNYFVLKENGKSKEYSGVKVFNGKWTMNTTDTIVLSDHTTGEPVCVDILCDPFGNISGFDIDGTIYTLAA